MLSCYYYTRMVFLLIHPTPSHFHIGCRTSFSVWLVLSRAHLPTSSLLAFNGDFYICPPGSSKIVLGSSFISSAFMFFLVCFLFFSSACNAQHMKNSEQHQRQNENGEKHRYCLRASFLGRSVPLAYLLASARP